MMIVSEYDLSESCLHSSHVSQRILGRNREKTKRSTYCFSWDIRCSKGAQPFKKKNCPGLNRCSSKATRNRPVVHWRLETSKVLKAHPIKSLRNEWLIHPPEKHKISQPCLVGHTLLKLPFTPLKSREKCHFSKKNHRKFSSLLLDICTLRRSGSKSKRHKSCRFGFVKLEKGRNPHIPASY